MKYLSILYISGGYLKACGVIGPFSKGLFYMAMDLYYPVVPSFFKGIRKLSAVGSLSQNQAKL